LLATFAIAYPILGGLRSVFGTIAAVVFVQGFLVEGLRFLGDWRNLLFGALIVLAMNLRPDGLIDGAAPGAAIRPGAASCLRCKASPSISAACVPSTASTSRSDQARCSA
jgi:hypothetical protein